MSRKSIDKSEETVVNLIFGCKESSLLRNVLRFWCLGHNIRMSSMYLARNSGFGWFDSVIFCRSTDIKMLAIVGAKAAPMAMPLF